MNTKVILTALFAVALAVGALLSLIATQVRTGLAATEPRPVPRAFELTTLDADELAHLLEQLGDEDAAAPAPHPNPAWI